MEKAEIAFARQVLIKNKFLVDALLTNDPVVIQIDGDYWHGNPEQFPNPDKRQRKRMALDKSQDAYMLKCGITVVRIWGSDLQMNPSFLLTKIEQVLDQLHSQATSV
jgi:very-short-patch-repair endonuclease